MLDLKRKPFNYLPINNGSLFDLTCEYLISLLEKLNIQYHTLVDKAGLITFNLPNANYELCKDCLNTVDSFIDDYSKLVKGCKLSLGKQVGKDKYKQQIFDCFSYRIKNKLHDLVTHQIRT